MISYDGWRVNQQLVLDLQFRESTGTVTRDWSKAYHDPATLSGTPTWTELGNDLTYLDFTPGNPDNITILAAASTDLNFTTSAFSGAFWIAPDAYGNRYLLDKSSATAGWAFWVSGVSPYIALTTANAGPATQTTYGAPELVLSSWQLASFTRSGAAVSIYLNGEEATSTAATHINPASAAAINTVMGTIVSAAAGWYDGKMWRPRVWNRALEAWEMNALFAAERALFGV